MKKKLEEDKVVEFVLDLEEWKHNSLDENMLPMMAAQLKLMLQSVIGFEVHNLIPTTGSAFSKIKGKKSDVEAFAKTLGREKRYIESWKRHGLDDPRTYKSKNLLNKAIDGFQKKTGIKWPFK